MKFNCAFIALALLSASSAHAASNHAAGDPSLVVYGASAPNSTDDRLMPHSAIEAAFLRGAQSAGYDLKQRGAATGYTLEFSYTALLVPQLQNMRSVTGSADFSDAATVHGKHVRASLCTRLDMFSWSAGPDEDKAVRDVLDNVENLARTAFAKCAAAK
jgi:opacity protein-like surface antigen